ncbi:uncharacterized protein LOC133196072 [Saccostrea echinata]|uniref:uncharacterized protein LOC133196072 n=1 Tax=Saccostrea echinata TaxID=191078 RepID=UPI002A8414FF|nr:uncharacterized protein LOC133196072 [Saccostrea echinata]
MAIIQQQSEYDFELYKPLYPKTCIGSFGRNCSGGLCTPGYYGHGCKELCECGTILCDRTRGCPHDDKSGTYHYWIYIVLGTLIINSIPITIAINVFISTRKRNTGGKQKNSLETAERKGKLNICADVLLKRFRRAPSTDDEDEDTEKPHESSLETPKRRGKLNVYVDSLLKRVRRAPAHSEEEEDSNKPKEDYFAMRMSMAPPKDNVHHFTGCDEEDEDDDDIEDYVEMNVQSNFTSKTQSKELYHSLKIFERKYEKPNNNSKNEYSRANFSQSGEAYDTTHGNKDGGILGGNVYSVSNTYIGVSENLYDSTSKEM